MGKTKSVPVAFADREIITTGEAMGLCLVEDYDTFNRNFLQKGLKYWREVGRIRYYRKKDVYNFIDKHGEKPLEIYNPFKKQ